jgi:hypothetical protein
MVETTANWNVQLELLGNIPLRGVVVRKASFSVRSSVPSGTVSATNVLDARSVAAPD